VVELRSLGVSAVAQSQMLVKYQSVPVGNYLADLLVENCLICEIKATRDLAAEHEAQIINYLKATGMKVGLLLNFGRSRLQFRRLIY
jgi:GxxExxY protein